eukprot:3188282-Pyramimonas_sp.AAC.1
MYSHHPTLRLAPLVPSGLPGIPDDSLPGIPDDSCQDSPTRCPLPNRRSCRSLEPCRKGPTRTHFRGKLNASVIKWPIKGLSAARHPWGGEN